MTIKQTSIQRSIKVSGHGLHCGKDVEITFLPAPADSGCVFKRIDLENQPTIKACAEYVVDTSRGTTLEQNGAKISTVEHILSAISGLGVDNILIEVNGPEIPIMNGSASMFVKALKDAEIIEQEEERNFFTISEKVVYKDEERGIEMIVYPDDDFSIELMIDYTPNFLFNQYANLSSMSDYELEISNCRTFVFLHELESLLQNNLIKGGDLNNAIVILDKDVSQEELNRLAKVFNKPEVKVKQQGILNNLELSFENEPARHKILDLIGDLHLVGAPIKGKIIARKPGHLANTEFAKILRQIYKKEKLKPKAPKYNPNIPPLLDINDIRKKLPHRPPFLLVDKILEMNKTSVVGLKNITMNESFFVGHFPEEPVMPGVLLIEAMAQVGGILVLNQVDDPENYSTYFMKIENAKFKRKVVPGDTVIFDLSITSPIRRGIANMKGQAFVGDNVVVEAELMAQVIKNK